ncbi:hypothetical protein [Mesorhizobium sp. M0778]|uniref:hypothetical protein n=1 Tax=Mesorhizobium sp. M0778 TaxID=2956999 RepID=UPI003334CB01
MILDHRVERVPEQETFRILELFEGIFVAYVYTTSANLPASFREAGGSPAFAGSSAITFFLAIAVSIFFFEWADAFILSGLCVQPQYL